MKIALIAVLAIPVLGMIGCALALIRNQWVYVRRMQVLEASIDAYEAMPDYDTMMAKWWIWDAARFIGMKSRDRKKARREKREAAGNRIIARAMKLGGHA